MIGLILEGINFSWNLPDFKYKINVYRIGDRGLTPHFPHIHLSFLFFPSMYTTVISSEDSPQLIGSLVLRLQIGGACGVRLD